MIFASESYKLSPSSLSSVLLDKRRVKEKEIHRLVQIFVKSSLFVYLFGLISPCNLYNTKICVYSLKVYIIKDLDIHQLKVSLISEIVCLFVCFLLLNLMLNSAYTSTGTNLYFFFFMLNVLLTLQ